MYACTHVDTIYVHLTTWCFTSFYICEPDFICGWKMLKSIKRYTSGIGKDL